MFRWKVRLWMCVGEQCFRFSIFSTAGACREMSNKLESEEKRISFRADCSDGHCHSRLNSHNPALSLTSQGHQNVIASKVLSPIKRCFNRYFVFWTTNSYRKTTRRECTYVRIILSYFYPKYFLFLLKASYKSTKEESPSTVRRDHNFFFVTNERKICFLFQSIDTGCNSIRESRMTSRAMPCRGVHETRWRRKKKKVKTSFLIEFGLFFSVRNAIQLERSILITQYFCTQHRLNLHIICLRTHTPQRAHIVSASPTQRSELCVQKKNIMKCDDDTKWKPNVGNGRKENYKRNDYEENIRRGWFSDDKLTLLSAEAFSFQYRGKICYFFSCCYILGTARCVGLDDEMTRNHRWRKNLRARLTLILGSQFQINSPPFTTFN